MINRLHALVAFAFCIAAAQVAVADDERPAPPGNLRDAAWFKQADKDGDGRLSREEAPNKAVFNDVDTDGDGFASVNELQVWLAARGGAWAQALAAGKAVRVAVDQVLGGPGTALRDGDFDEWHVSSASRTGRAPGPRWC